MCGAEEHRVEIDDRTLPGPSQTPNVEVMGTRLGKLDVVLLVS